MVHHGAALRQIVKDDELVQQLIRDHRQADLPSHERAMLAYVDKLTRCPSTITREDVARLAEHGFDDADILNIAQVAAIFAYLNRIADGLGIPLEADAEELARMLEMPVKRRNRDNDG